MNYQVSIIGKTTIIADHRTGFRLIAGAADDIAVEDQTAWCLGTLYQVRGGYVPAQLFHFVAVNSKDQALAEASVQAVKAAADFFFTSIIGTELYVKEIPQSSSLFAQESVRLFGAAPVAA